MLVSSAPCLEYERKALIKADICELFTERRVSLKAQILCAMLKEQDEKS